LPIAVERSFRARRPQKLPLTQKPSEEFLEGFYRERITVPARGCGLRG
jgi:hypothetical protein